MSLQAKHSEAYMAFLVLMVMVFAFAAGRWLGLHGRDSTPGSLTPAVFFGLMAAINAVIVCIRYRRAMLPKGP